MLGIKGGGDGASEKLRRKQKRQKCTQTKRKTLLCQRQVCLLTDKSHLAGNMLNIRFVIAAAAGLNMAAVTVSAVPVPGVYTPKRL